MTWQRVTHIELHLTWFCWSLTSLLISETNFWIGIIDLRLLKPIKNIKAQISYSRVLREDCTTNQGQLLA